MEPSILDLSKWLFLQKQVQLFGDMQKDVELYQQKALPAETAIQGCFDIAHNYKSKLTEEVSLHEFESIAEEIIYFRHIRPLFNAECEYHSYCYHVELFRKAIEDNDPLELELFYRRQLKRMDKFARENREIYEYLVANRSDRDAEWFTRSKEDQAFSLYDKQVAVYRAILRFEKYVTQELLGLGAVTERKEDQS